MRFVDVEPPAKFTGDWRIYYVNGHIFSEGQYKNGRAEGKGVVFFPDGKKLMEQTVSSAKGKFEVEETSYYPSGSVKHKGHYEDNKQAGTWTWYNEDGSVQSKREFPNPQN